MFVGLQMLGHLYIDLRGDTKEWSQVAHSFIFLTEFFKEQKF